MPLTGAAARQLRALAHHLDPVVQVGKEAVTKGVVAQVARALLDHELIKVKIGSESPVDRKIAALKAHASQTGHFDVGDLVRNWAAATAATAGLPDGRLAEAFLTVHTG